MLMTRLFFKELLVHPPVLGAAVLITGLGLFLANTTAQAFSIDYSVHSSGYSVSGNETAADLLTAFNTSNPSYCDDISLNSFTNVSSNNLCGGGNSNLAYLIDVNFSLAETKTIDFQAGMDWGRGGGVIEDGNLEYITSDDIWWSYNWGNTDVIETSHVLSGGSHTLRWIGFEGCCNGLSSLRFRVDGGAWEDLSAANFSSYEGTPSSVPVPAPLMLITLGGLWLARRRS